MRERNPALNADEDRREPRKIAAGAPMVTKKDCDGADGLAATVRVTEADAPLVSVTLDLLRSN